MISYNLSKYLKVKLDSDSVSAGKGNGFVITLSRDIGCEGKDLAKAIVDKLNSVKSPVGKNVTWKLLSKEILEKSAEELKLHPDKLDSLMKGQQGSIVEELLLSFSNQYPNDIKIKNTIKEVIENAANEGNVLILGRAAEVITMDRRNSLRFKVTAPYEWRVKNLMKNDKIPESKARELINRIDKERNELRDFYLGNRNEDGLYYHTIFNRKLLSEEEIEDMIIHTLELKKKSGKY